MYDINVIVNKVACTLVKEKYFSQNFSPPLKNSLRPWLRTYIKLEHEDAEQHLPHVVV